MVAPIGLQNQQYFMKCFFNIKLCWVFLVFVLSTVQHHAQYTPYFQNFDLSQYNAGNQNWDVSKASNGKVYVANNKGLLEYDGLRWALYQMPNKTVVRSVLSHDDRVYVGSYQEFGYWSRSKKGEMLYTSLSDQIENKNFFSEEFWQITAFKGAIVFRSFLNLYIYTEGKIESKRPVSTVISCDVVGDRFLVSTLREGVFELKGGELIPFISDSRLEDERVISITEKEGGLFICTALSGCFLYSNGRMDSWDKEISPVLKEHQLNELTQLHSGDMAFGTIQNGIYITDKNGTIKFHINKENGLINNTVLGQCVDQQDQLWIGMDNGLSAIDMNSSVVFYNDVSGRLGAVYDIIDFEGMIYLGSNTGLYNIDDNNQLQFISGSQGQVWELKEIDGQLFCGHNNGTYVVENRRLRQISASTGGWTLKKVPDHNNLYIQGVYAGVVRFTKSPETSQWESKHIYSPDPIPIRFLVFENSSTAWAAHAYQGLYRLKFNKAFDSVVSMENYGRKGLNSDYNLRVYKLMNDICVKTNEGWHKYEPLIDSLVPYQELNNRLEKNSYIISEPDIEEVAIKKGQLLSIQSLHEEKPDHVIFEKFYHERGIIGYENVSKLNDSILALNLNDGFMSININQKPNKQLVFQPKVESIVLNGQKVELLDEGQEVVVLPNNYQNFSINISSPKSSNHIFQYSVANRESTNWKLLETGSLELPSLNYGNHEIWFRTMNEVGISSKVEKVFIEVKPPWYRSTTSFLIYFSLLALLIWLFYYLHKRKVQREQRLLKIELAKEQRGILMRKTIENERRIVELKNESLKNEVKLKSKQLANTAMALVKKNEVLQTIKKEVADHKNAFGDYYAYKKLMKQIDGSIKEKDEWNLFEYNFNQVHEDYFKVLNKKHPHLSPKDLKLCAYIKMNLSSKEIAPLLNISVRGVETQRYRLKQKLDLESDKSVTEYLHNLK